MCGFVGLADFSSSYTLHQKFIDVALDDLGRRGPDQKGIWIDKNNNVLFGFRRLSIRDLSEAGSQPMSSSSGNFIIIYNGETYNTDELIKWANIQTEELVGHSDTEIILQCIEKKGLEATVTKMDGIFVMALYDQKEKKIFLCRDHAGVKPLYFGINESGLVFSSHYHHVTSHSFFKAEELDASSLANYFRYGFIQEGEGLLKNTYFMPHGHIVEADLNGNWEWRPYISFTREIKSNERSISEKQEELLNVYHSVAESQLVSDVPIGTFMSGGVDSTLTTAVVSKLKPNIKAYTISVDDPKLDEADEAKRFASYFEVDHKINDITEQEVIKAITQNNDAYAEPLADFSSLITLKVCEIAKEDLTVVLSGDGGDELFWGYTRFQTAGKLYKYLQLPLYKRVVKVIYERLKGGKIPLNLLRFKNFSEYYLSKQGIPGHSIWIKSLFRDQPEERKPYMYRLLYKQPFKKKNEALTFAKDLEFHIHMQRVLLKVDRASMYHSLEVRTPMLSKRFIEHSFLYEFEECISKKEGKVPLRNALQAFLPNNSRNSGEKKGFAPPLDDWLRGTLKNKVKDRIQNIPEILKPYLDRDIILRMWDEHQNGKNWSWMIWSLYTLFIWVEDKMYSIES